MSDLVGFINDGYTRQGYIAACDWHPELRFEYRPCTAAAADAISTKLTQLRTAGKSGDAPKATAEWALSRLKSWVLVDASGNTVPLTAANYQMQERHQEEKLFSILLGDRLSDPDPLKVSEPISEAAEAKN